MPRKRPSGDKHAIPEGEAESFGDYVEEAPKAKRGRGREAGFRMSDTHRSKIQKSQIIRSLIDHVQGRRDMSASQVTAGLGLLKKVLPDLQAVTVSGDPKNPIGHNHSFDLSGLSDNELSRLLGSSPDKD